MKRILALLLGVVAASAAFAQTGPLTIDEQIDIIRRGKNHARQIQDLRVKDTATIGGNVTITGDISLGDDLVVSGAVTVVESVSAASVSAATVSNTAGKVFGNAFWLIGDRTNTGYLAIRDTQLVFIAVTWAGTNMVPHQTNVVGGEVFLRVP